MKKYIVWFMFLIGCSTFTQNVREVASRIPTPKSGSEFDLIEVKQDSEKSWQIRIENECCIEKTIAGWNKIAAEKCLGLGFSGFDPDILTHVEWDDGAIEEVVVFGTAECL